MSISALLFFVVWIEKSDSIGINRLWYCRGPRAQTHPPPGGATTCGGTEAGAVTTAFQLVLPQQER